MLRLRSCRLGGLFALVLMEPCGLMMRRMEGFKEPWDSAVFKGRLLAPDKALQECGIASGDMIITVRRALVPEGELGAQRSLISGDTPWLCCTPAALASGDLPTQCAGGFTKGKGGAEVGGIGSMLSLCTVGA